MRTVQFTNCLEPLIEVWPSQSEEEIKQHPFALNERRASDRKTQNQEIQLRRRISNDSSVQSGTLSIPFEVSSMGIYEQDAVTGEKKYKGTYGIARDITARKQAESVIRFQAYHDLLTGLPNRSLLKDRLKLAISQAKRSNEKVVFMFLDLDRFKIVNDTLGHTIGDQYCKRWRGDYKVVFVKVTRYQDSMAMNSPCYYQESKLKPMLKQSLLKSWRF